MNGFWQAMRWDWRMLHRSGIGTAAMVLMLALATLAAWSGLHAAGGWRAQVDAAHLRAAEAHDQLLAKIAAGDAWSAAPYSARGLIALPPAPLADLAVGRSDLDPRIADATTFGQSHILFRDYQIGSPMALALGHFDMAFVVQALLPLLIVALSYGLMAEERERGLDRMLAVQNVPQRRLLLARVLTRAALVLAPLLLVLAALFVAGDGALASPAQRGLRFGWALLLIIGYAAFWWALAAWMGSWRLREGQTLLALLAAWALLVLALPAMAGLFARAAHPPPSRFALIAEARAKEIAGTQRSEALLGQYAHDHPEMDATASADMPQWARTVFVVSREVDAGVAPVVEAFDTALAAQHRSVERWQYVSPALIVQRGLMTAAGTDERRNAAFRAQARDYFRGYREHTGAMMLSGKRLDAESLAAMPRFVFVEPNAQGIVQALAMPLLALWGVTLLLAALAWRRASRTVMD